MAHYKGIIYAHDNDGTKIALSVKAQLTTFMALFTLIFNIISRITTQVFASNSHQKVIMSIQLDHFSNFMNRIASFTPITTPSARVLILGSMPGAISLSSDQYYAHPRNAFWGIMAALLGFSRTTPYKERIDALKKADIALWDVMHSCVRPGSLDSNIETDSIEVHDFKSFFEQYPNDKAQHFLKFLLDRYEKEGSTELSRTYLPTLIELSGLGTTKDISIAFGGKPVHLLSAFKNLQQQLYRVN